MIYNLNRARFVPVAAPFLLGALTGGVAVGALNNMKPTTYYVSPPYYVTPPYYVYPTYY